MNKKRFLPLALWFSVWMGGATAIAGQISIKWQADPGAGQYELEVKRDDRVVFARRFPPTQTAWKGSLPFGNYTYRLRSYDRDLEPGIWSEAIAFQVFPPPPRLLFPLENSTILVKPGPGIQLKWSKVEGVKQYLLHLKGVQLAEQKSLVQGNEFSNPALGPGEYTWRVTPIIEGSEKAEDEKPLNAPDRSSKEGHFKVELTEETRRSGDLQSIILLHPEGEISLVTRDYVCLYATEKPNANAVACGLVSFKKAHSAGLNLLIQSVHLKEGAKYYIADPNRDRSRSPASSLGPDELCEISLEGPTFDWNLTSGISFGPGYFFPHLDANRVVSRQVALGLEYAYANESAADAYSRMSGLALTGAYYFGKRPFLGFFAEAGVGADVFSASLSGANQSHLAPLGMLGLGWQWHPTQQGFNLILALRSQYVADPKITLVQTKLSGLLYLSSVSIGYAF